MAERPSQKALADFVAEAQETVEGLDADLLRLEDARRGVEVDPDSLNAVFRAAHSLKGLASMFGVERMATLAHALEDLLDDIRMGRRGLDGTTLDLLLAAPDLFGRIVAEEAEQRPAATAEAAAVLAEHLRAREAPAAPDLDPLRGLDLPEAVRQVLTEYEEHRLRAGLARGLHVYRAKASFDIATFDTALEALKTKLKAAGEVICTLPAANPGEPLAIAFDVLVASGLELEAVQEAGGVEVEAVARGAAPAGEVPAPARTDGPGPAPPPAAAPGPPAPVTRLPAPAPAAEVESTSLRSLSQAVRVDIAKLDRLLNTVAELALVRTGVAGLVERLRSGEEAVRVGLELSREVRLLDRKLGEMQAGILEVRMVPLSQVFDKLSRMVRKATRDLGKEVDFQLDGGEVELDKLIVEELSDPLMHLIRNSLDHGIEPAPERRSAGKAATGVVRLAARQKGSHVEIVVEDDGRGIDEARVREVAVQRGLTTAEDAAALSRRETLNLIFLPGFSTARKVTTLSGRGVGMDVVKHNIANMSGIIDVVTEPGFGTRFEITLPVTLAIVRALLVGVSGRSYAVPLSSVIEVLEVKPSEIRTIEGREVISLRGTTLPLARLDRIFGLPPPPAGRAFVVVAGLAQQRLGVVVDQLLGEQDVVVKPLGKALGGIRGIAGATDLGNRRTVLVVDVGAILGEVAGGAPPEAAESA